MLWIKAFHIIFMVTWFAGLFYLPRLFVYHAVTTDEIGNERFKVMERKLLIIMTMGAVFTVLFGTILWLGFGFSGLWLHLKLALVAMLILYHYLCAKVVREFRNDCNRRSHVFYRWFNEFPALILMLVVILVVVKPF